MTLHPISGKSYFLLLALLLISAFSPAQTAVPVVLAPVPQLQFFTQSGQPDSFGCVFSYQSQTTNPLATFTDFTGQFQNPNPVILSAGGSANIWLQSGQAYSLTVKSSGGTNCSLGQTLYTVDGVGGGASQLNTVVTPSGGSAAFTVQSQNQLFSLTLTGNVAGSPVSFIGVIAPALITFQITEDGAGSHTFSWPSNVTGAAPIDTVANQTTSQTFIWNGTTIMPVGLGASTRGRTSVDTLNNIARVGGSRYPCSSGITSAIADTVAAGGGVVDASGCIGSFTGASWTIGATSAPVTLLLGPSSWAMGSNIITLANGSKIIGLGHQSTTLTWTGDVDGIITPTGTTGGNVVVQGLSLVSGGLASATHAVVHLDDCPYCQVDDVFVSFDSSAASAGIRIEAVTANSGYGTWSGTISRSTVQRTSANQGTRATSGQIDIDFKGNSAITNGNVSRWTLWGNHLEGGTVNFQIFCGSANQLTGGDMFSGAPSVNITGNGSCNSNDNYIATELNGVSIAGSKAFAIDAFSNFNTIAGDISQNLVAPTDAGAENVKWYSANTLGAGVYSVPQLSAGKLTQLNVVNGVSADGAGYKHKRFGATCTTTNTIGNSCTTTYSWTTTFVDANYTPVCSGVGPANGPTFAIDSFNAAGVTVRVATIVALASGYSGVDCIAPHD